LNERGGHFFSERGGGRADQQIFVAQLLRIDAPVYDFAEADRLWRERAGRPDVIE